MLEQWARWARSNPELARIDYPSIQPYTRMVKSKHTKQCCLNDDEAMAIDLALARLKSRDAEMGRATMLYYWLGQNVSMVSRVLGIQRKRANLLVASGTAWIDAALLH